MFVTGTVYDGRETMRACILHPGSTETDLATLVAEVVATAADLAATNRGRQNESVARPAEQVASRVRWSLLLANAGHVEAAN